MKNENNEKKINKKKKKKKKKKSKKRTERALSSPGTIPVQKARRIAVGARGGWDGPTKHHYITRRCGVIETRSKIPSATHDSYPKNHGITRTTQNTPP
jgi:hypothetical protein